MNTAMPAQRFGFQDYAKGQFEEIKEILRNMNTTFMPREEINLRLSELIKTQANISETLSTHARSIEALKEISSRQNWADGSRKSRLIIIGAYSGAAIAILLWIVDKVVPHFH